MHIKNIKINNYKCFLDSGKIEMDPYFNILVGKNDAGKTSLIEALSANTPNKPHLSPNSIESSAHLPNPDSTIEIIYSLTTKDIELLLMRKPEFYIPYIGPNHGKCFENFCEAISKDVNFVSIWSNRQPIDSYIEEFGKKRKHHYLHVKNAGHPNKLDLIFNGAMPESHIYQDYAADIARDILSRCFAFKAERTNIDNSTIDGKAELLPNAQNLAPALHQLSTTSRIRFDRIVSHLKTIFPHITQISIPPIDGPKAHIKVWTIPEDLDRSDLAIPLSESGTGIGQVLAMLYVAVNSDGPRTIIIDEPQSFLHPGAVRKLMEIFRLNPIHQYIISTHSPLALSADRKEKIILIQKDGYESKVTTLDPGNKDNLRDFLLEVGARIGDIFGADNILWVEGKTEEICFPIIITKSSRTPLQGTKILGVISTDELSTKHAERVYDIYERLSNGASLMPPALAFLFDREDRSEQVRADIERKSKNLVRWLPVRLYENYLLEPRAIANAINIVDISRSKPASEEAVSDWIIENGLGKTYIKDDTGTIKVNDDKWYEQVHGAKLLIDLFSAITEARVSYDKVKHGLMLTEHLIDAPTGRFRELAKMLGDIIKQGRT